LPRAVSAVSLPSLPFSLGGWAKKRKISIDADKERRV